MAFRPWSRVPVVFRFVSLNKISPAKGRVRLLSSASKPLDADLEAMLRKPSWSVKSLFQSNAIQQGSPITQKQLHHLLRLSALPLPTSSEQEEKMIANLQSQLIFVQAIQSVDTTNVEPLQSIRDETQDAETQQEVTVATLQEEFDKEEVLGRRGRIRRRKDAQPTIKEHIEGWDPLGQAPRKMGRFFVVDTAQD